MKKRYDPSLRGEIERKLDFLCRFDSAIGTILVAPLAYQTLEQLGSEGGGLSALISNMLTLAAVIILANILMPREITGQWRAGILIVTGGVCAAMLALAQELPPLPFATVLPLAALWFMNFRAQSTMHLIRMRASLANIFASH
ncbi:MAG: hypothetical protein VW877_17070 [Pseudomonadaceae bacterium]